MKQDKHHVSLIERFTRWIGSTSSLVFHTIAFIAAFSVGVFHIVPWELVLLVLTTLLSLEAIYLAIFIQITVNRNTASLREVEQDIDEIQVDIDEVQEDVAEISEDIDEVQVDMAEISEDIDEIQEDIDEVQEDIQEDDQAGRKRGAMIDEVSATLQKLLKDIEELKK